MTNPKFEPVLKDQLFYNRYKYCMRFRLPEVSVMRQLDHDRIDAILNFRIESRREAALRYKSYTSKHAIGNVIPIIQSTRWREITDEMRENLHAVADFLIATRVDYKLVISVDLAWLYTNNKNLINELRAFPVYAKKYSKAIVNRPKNTVVLNESIYKYRSYFRMLDLSKQEKDVLKTFLNNNQESMRLSPALKHWLAEDFHRTQSYFFVDYAETVWQTMFGLVRPGLLKKTYDIILNK